MSTPNAPILNIAAYRFVEIRDCPSWVGPIRDRCTELGLKGTVIVAPEGINLFLAGSTAAIEGLLEWLAADPRFIVADGTPVLAGAAIKRSWSTERPFGHLRVRHRPEIVTMRRPEVRPAAGRAPVVAPRVLARWIAEGHDVDGRPIALVDTRNAFEVERGTFAGARHLALTRFDQFPAAIDALPDDLRDALRGRTVVTFCTGGIRCEKAALYLQAAGHPEVRQLDGGILGYFDAVGSAGWEGECFVFDERIALSPDLAVAGRLQPGAAAASRTSISSDVKPAA